MATNEFNAAQWALQSQLDGLSAREGLVQFREAGGHIASSTWFRAVGEVQAMLASREGIYNEPVNLRPVASEIQVWTTQKAKGFIQQVEVLVRERETGQIISVPFSVTGRTLVSRRNAIAQALDVYSDDNAKKYNQQVLGAVYTGTYEARPEGG
jgi:hypothetical protein